MEKRLINRITVDGFKIKFKIDGIIEPHERKVEDISLKGLSFLKLKKEYLEKDTQYEFILNRNNIYIFGTSYLVYETKDKFGIAFQYIDNEQYKQLCDFLDPVYAGLNLEPVKSIIKPNLIDLKYEALKSGLTFKYKKEALNENFEISFLDKYISYDNKKNLKVGVVLDYKGEINFLNSKNAIYNEVVSTISILIENSKINQNIKSRVLQLIC